MRFRIVQRLPGPLDRVEAAFVDPEFLDRLAELPKLGRPTLLDQHVDGELVHQRVQYAFAGHLSSAVTAVVDPARLTWIEDSTLDRRSHRTTFRIVPDHYRDRLACEGTFTLQPDDEGTRRTAEGDLRVRFPLVGGKVERAIVSGLEEHADLEADVMSRWLKEHEG
jgi:hypothetical protein